MIQYCINAVSEKLHNCFEGAKVYAENVEMGLQKPCFTLGIRESKMKNLLGRRKLYKITLCVHYIGSTGKKIDMNNVADKLYKNLEFVECEEKGFMFYGNNMNYKMSDNGRECDFFV